MITEDQLLQAWDEVLDKCPYALYSVHDGLKLNEYGARALVAALHGTLERAPVKSGGGGKLLTPTEAANEMLQLLADNVTAAS